MGGGFGEGPQKFQNRPRAKFFWPKVAKRFIVTYIIDNSEKDFRDETTLHPPPLSTQRLAEKFMSKSMRGVEATA